MGLSSAVETGRVHDRVGAFVGERNVPGVAPLYRSVAERPQNVLVGEVVTATPSTLLVRTQQGEEVTVNISIVLSAHRGSLRQKEGWWWCSVRFRVR